MPNNVSRSTAVGAILHPGGPARSPLARNNQHSRSNSINKLNASNSSGTSSPRDDYSSNSFTFPLGGGGGSGGGFGSGAEDVDFLLAVSSDEILLRRLNEFNGSETVSTSGKGTDAMWKLESEEAVKALGMFMGIV